MSYKKLIPFINGENELAANVVTMAEDYCFAGADERRNAGYDRTKIVMQIIKSNVRRKV